MIPFFMRRATADDVNPVSKLLSSSKLPTEGVAESIDNFVIAEVGDAIVGAIGIEVYGRYGLLRSAVVAPEKQGQGIGHALVGELLSKARSRGIASVYLLTTTAENYFPSFGFVRTDRKLVPSELGASAELRGACPDTATVMRLDL